MTSAARWIRLVVFISVFFVVGGGLLYTGYRITPNINDRSIPLGEWRSQSRLGGAVTALGSVSVMFGGILVWAAVRGEQKRRRHASHINANGPGRPPGA